MLKQSAKSALQRLGIFSAVRLAYRRLNPLIAALRQREIKLYRELLKPNSLCFDIGANLGQKSEIFLSAGFRTVAIEPNAHCQESLRLQFANHPRATIVQQAVGSTIGTTMLYANGSDAAASLLPEWHQVIYGQQCPTPPQLVEVTTLDQLIQRFGRPDYVKIDVEGFESEVLRGLSQTVPIISFEFHVKRSEAMKNCLDQLGGLGMTDFRASDMYGNWLSPWMKDPSALVNLVEQTRAEGDIYASSLWRG
jgi:FkbM family methyltransferase